MLVLSRKAGERIWIGDDISVTVVRISGGGVRIGIQAPKVRAGWRDQHSTIFGSGRDVARAAMGEAPIKERL